MNASSDGSWTADGQAPNADATAPIFPFPVQPITARQQLRQAVIAALARANLTVAGKVIARIDSPGNWPYPQEALPAVCVRSPNDRKTSLTKGNTDFTTTVEIEVRAAVAATTAEAAQSAIEALWFQIEQRILTDFYVLQIVQNVTTIESGYDIVADGQMQIAGARGRYSFETFESFDISQQFGAITPPSEAPPIVELTEVTVDVTRPQSDPAYSEQPGDVGLTITLAGD